MAPDAPGPKWSKTARENIFAALRAIEAAIPRETDKDCEASGRVIFADLNHATALPVEAIRRSLTFLRDWRVLWVSFADHGEAAVIRFQRQVVVGLLAAERVCPHDVPRFMVAHRLHREKLAPMPKKERAQRGPYLRRVSRSGAVVSARGTSVRLTRGV